ncbi:MAG: M23 family metallopeptidase [Gemmatimonadales bacterium]|jgi:murein DD-endopeptidase MepM/ murein hydrolase activator NlpD
MDGRRWRVVVVPPGAGSSKVLEVSQTAVKLVLGVGLVVGLAAVLLGYVTLSRSIAFSRNASLTRENQLLAEQIGQVQTRLISLNDTLQSITAQNARIRVLANLDPIDPQVAEAGVGGPAARSATDSELASSGILGQRATEVRVDVNGLIRRANLLASSFNQAAESLASHSQRLEALPSIMPTHGWLTSAFSAMRAHPILHINRPHEGIDISAPMGAPIEAPANGVITSAGWENGYGNVVIIDHGYGIVTKFAHCSKLLVRAGQRVHRGDRIALVGNTGLATGPHMHYEVHVNGKPVDPLRYVMPDAVVD